MVDPSYILTERLGSVGQITIARRDRFNSLDVTTARDLRRAGLELARDEAIRAVLIRGENGVFCSGADLKYIRGGGDQAGLGYLSPAAREVPKGYGEVFKQILEYIHSTISEIRRAPKPFIAAVDGIAAAGGLGLAMCCDLVIASERSTFEWAYGKTALTGAESSTFFLPRLIGARRASTMAFMNPRLSAAQALSWGLISEVMPNERFEEAALNLARKVAEGPTGSYAVTKRMLNQSLGVERLDVHLDQELEALARSADSADFKEGLDAFFGKRPPRFTGR